MSKSIDRVQKNNNVWGQVLSIKNSCLQMLALSRVAENAATILMGLQQTRTLSGSEQTILTLANTVMRDVLAFHRRYKEIEARHANKNNDANDLEDYAEALQVASLYDQWVMEYTGVVTTNILAIQRELPNLNPASGETAHV